MARYERNFHTQLHQLLNKEVSLNSGGPMAINGQVVFVGSDYIVVQRENNPGLMVPMEQIRVIAQGPPQR